MNKITTYFRESYKELLEKVTWPSWLQLQQSTVIVLIATLLITMIVLGATLVLIGVVALMDFVANGSMKFIYSLFK